MLTPVRKIAKPWGHELILAHTERYAGKILHVEPGEALSLQYHRDKDETLYLLAGACELQVEENGALTARQMGEGDAYHLPPGTRHRLIAGARGCDLIEVSTPELDDVVRLEDRYGRL
jgi:mannose-6-phosphate isomerase-like protein (cupin superfamily)